MTARSTTDDGADAPASSEGAVAPDATPTKVTRARATTSGRATPPTAVSGVEPTRADRIVVTQGGIGRARAGGITVSQGGVGLAQADSVSLERGLIGAAFGQETRLVQSMSNVVMGGEATVEQSLVGTMVTGQVTVSQPSAIGILIAGRVDGSVRPILDWRGAIAFGVAYALVLGILRRGRR